MTSIKENVSLDLFKDEEEDLFNPSLGVFDGSDVTVDGAMVNAILERIPLLNKTGCRYWAICNPETDGLDGIHIGTLKGARKKAQGILFRRHNIIEGKASRVEEATKLLPDKF